MEQLLNMKEICKILKITEKTLKEWVKRGLPYYPTNGGQRRYVLEDVVDWCDTHTEKEKR